MKLKLLVFSLFCALTLHGQQLDHLTLPVRDLNVSLSFYRDVLGLKPIKNPFHDKDHVFLSLGGSLQLHLVHPTSPVKPSPDAHFALRFSSMDAAIKQLQANHVKYFDSDDHPSKISTRPDGVHQIYFQDPDGHWIEINDRK